MIIAICVQHPQVYQQLVAGLHSPKSFRFSEFRRLSMLPSISDADGMTNCVTSRHVDLLILDSRLSFFQKAQVLCDQYQIEYIVFNGDVQTTLHEVDMFASFYIDGESESTEPQKLSKRVPLPKEVVVKIGEKVVEKEIQRLHYTNIPQKVIVIGSLWSGAGSTLYAVNLARALAERHIEVSYVEFPKMKPYVFDYLNISQLEKDLGLPYSDYAKNSTSEANLRVSGFRYKGIQWVVNDSRLPLVSEWTGEDMMKLIYSLRDTPIIILDISNHWTDPGIQSFLTHADHIYVCVEPDPVKIDRTSLFERKATNESPNSNEYSTLKFLQSLQLKGYEYQFIEMKMNKKVKVRTWRECLEKPPLSSLNLIPYEDVIASVWESAFLYDNPRYTKTFEKSFRPVMVSLLPKKYVNLNSKSQRGTLKKWMKRSETK